MPLINWYCRWKAETESMWQVRQTQIQRNKSKIMIISLKKWTKVHKRLQKDCEIGLDRGREWKGIDREKEVKTVKWYSQIDNDR